jgi:hypothetical protein
VLEETLSLDKGSKGVLGLVQNDGTWEITRHEIANLDIQRIILTIGAGSSVPRLSGRFGLVRCFFG